MQTTSALNHNPPENPLNNQKSTPGRLTLCTGVFKKGICMNQDNASSLSIPTAELTEGEPKQLELNGEKLCVVKVQGEIYALSDTCTHAQIPMSTGAVDGHELICPWHGAAFDVRTGIPTCGPATIPLRCYNVTIEGDNANITPKNYAADESN